MSIVALVRQECEESDTDWLNTRLTHIGATVTSFYGLISARRSLTTVKYDLVLMDADTPVEIEYLLHLLQKKIKKLNNM